MITLTEQTLRIESSTTIAVFEGIRLVSLQDKNSGEEFLRRETAAQTAGFELHHHNGKVTTLGVHPLASSVHTFVLSQTVAEIRLNDWEGDMSVRVSIDAANGDILIEPSLWSMAKGIAGIGWVIAGLRQDLQVVAPLQQGMRLPLDHPQIAGKQAPWPSVWEAGFLVFEGSQGAAQERSGFTVQTWDERMMFKGIRIGHAGCAHSAAFLTWAPGPWEQNQAVGNIAWRISAFRGGWKVPVRRYRDWYWKAFRLADAAPLRPAWLDDLRLAISWCPTRPEILDQLATQIDPHKVFIHLPNWRPFIYDQDYPDFRPSPEGAAFLRKAKEMGYHTAPHLNSCQMSPDHPLFFSARDFCTRAPDTLHWGGWTWLPVEGWAANSPPQSYSLMPTQKSWNTLVNVHLAWSPWRRELTRSTAALIAEVGLDSVFVDVSQLIHNSDNAFVEGMSYAQGSLKLIRELSELAPGFCVSGEGRNEISTQFLSVTQFHLFNFAHVHATDGEDVSWLTEATLPVNEELFSGLTRGIGYSYGSGSNRRVMIDASIAQGGIPTLIFERDDDILAQLAGEECQYVISRVA